MYHEVRGREALRTRCLSCNAGTGVGLVETAELHQSGDLRLNRHIDNDDRLQTAAGILGEQRNVEHNDAIGRHLFHHAAVHLRADGWVNDAV